MATHLYPQLFCNALYIFKKIKSVSVIELINQFPCLLFFFQSYYYILSYRSCNLRQPILLIFSYLFLDSLEFFEFQPLHYKMSSGVSSFLSHLLLLPSLCRSCRVSVTSFPILPIFYLQRHSCSETQSSSETLPSHCPTHPGSNLNSPHELQRVLQTL